MGYDDGYNQGRAGGKLPQGMGAEYREGYEDGRGEWKMAQGIRPVDADYYDVNPAPSGFKWANRKAVPQPGEWYLSKNGNAILSEKVRGNAQTRHILIPTR